MTIIALLLLCSCQQRRDDGGSASMLGGGEQPFEDCRWISAEMDHGRTNQWVCFRKEFDCTGKEKEAIMHIEVRNSTGRPCLLAVPPTESGLRLNGKAFPANSLKTVEGALNSINDGLPAIESPARKIVVEYKIQDK